MAAIQRCTRCPQHADWRAPKRFCDDCARINRARQHAGLIKTPEEKDGPSRGNSMYPMVNGPYRGARRPARYRNSPRPVVTAYLKRTKNGWYRGAAMLDGVDVYVGEATRSKQEAWDYAGMSAQCIKDGLAFEYGC